MSFVPNSYQQISLFDSLGILSPRKQRILDKSWAKPFLDYIFSNINEMIFAPLYSDKVNSRPNAPVNVIAVALILKEFKGLTDDGILEEDECDFRYQYDVSTRSDASFIKEYIEKVSVPDQPVALIADGAYSGEKIQELACEKNIGVLTTGLLGRKQKTYSLNLRYPMMTAVLYPAPRAIDRKAAHTSSRLTASGYHSKLKNAADVHDRLNVIRPCMQKPRVSFFP